MIETALDSCSDIHAQLSSFMCELQSRRQTMNSLISHKESAEVPGRGKRDGCEFFLPTVYTALH